MPGQVDFYLLETADESTRMKTVCRLAEKVQRLGHKILVLTNDAKQSNMLDALMWTFSQSSFLPHAVVNQPADYGSDDTLTQTPVLIYHELLENPPGVLINLKDELPQSAGLERVVEIVNQDERVKISGRQKYRGYQKQQFAIKMHQLQT